MATAARADAQKSACARHPVTFGWGYERDAPRSSHSARRAGQVRPTNLQRATCDFETCHLRSPKESQAKTKMVARFLPSSAQQGLSMQTHIVLGGGARVSRCPSAGLCLPWAALARSLSFVAPRMPTAIALTSGKNARTPLQQHMHKAPHRPARPCHHDLGQRCATHAHDRSFETQPRMELRMQTDLLLKMPRSDKSVR